MPKLLRLPVTTRSIKNTAARTYQPKYNMGYLEIEPETRKQLMDYAQSAGDLDWDDPGVDSRVGEMLALVGATTEYQFG